MLVGNVFTFPAEICHFWPALASGLTVGTSPFLLRRCFSQDSLTIDSQVSQQGGSHTMLPWNIHYAVI